MEFRLIYRGSLPAQNSGGGGGLSKEKHAIRKDLHKQLAVLWKEHPMLSRWIEKTITIQEAGETRIFSGAEEMASHHASFGFNWLPLVREDLGIAVGLDIVFLRRDAPGRIIGGGGDIDNRLKVLFDALRKPKNPEEVAGFVPEDGENPFFCLLEDDLLINDVRITTDRLLTPLLTGEAKNDVFLMIHVRTIVVDSERAYIEFYQTFLRWPRSKGYWPPCMNQSRLWCSWRRLLAFV